MRLLITGGAGFVGSNLATAFKRDNPDWDIVALDNLYRRGSELHIQRFKKIGVTFIHGDIRIKDDILRIGHFDLLIECSAEPSVLSGYQSLNTYLTQTNLVGAINCFEACLAHRADIIFLSTSRVYPYKTISNLTYNELAKGFALTPEQHIPGVSAQHGFSEHFPLEGVRSLYGATKLSAELILTEYMDAYNLRGVINRCGVLTGPWQMGKVEQGFVVLWMARHLWKGELAYIGYGGLGKQVRDILHVDDLYALIRRQIDQLSAIEGNVFNVGGGMPFSLSLLELTDLCREITGNTIRITQIPETRIADIPYYISDSRQVNSATGWRPQKNIQSILNDIYLWLCKFEKQLKPILTGE